MDTPTRTATRDPADRLDGPLGLVALVVAVNLVGSAPALLAGPDSAWFAALDKPAIYPPSVVFGIVWTALFTLQATALWLVLRADAGRDRRAAVALFVVQLAVNLTWTPAFFALQDLQVALGIIGLLFVLVAATLAAFGRVDRRAALLVVPYLAWVAFAGVLNYRFLVLN
ncbi:TspO/MBR family protein [Candidatus Halobonum tyrrellensis]|uniref:Tryptophan-rich sensory protein n=1 Tax=Candidatus Halobonum tyrrellensis G22 TaxID=1324957 RepID=V4HL41_9EURY|nr:TspO/MBR family protein [Candidatus Halobonum tyrrellensis]ESP88644.1 tryptophan-rich sensory protein [Candidatus Halobonum tyrrellensis G22]